MAGKPLLVANSFGQGGMCRGTTGPGKGMSGIRNNFLPSKEPSYSLQLTVVGCWIAKLRFF